MGALLDFVTSDEYLTLTEYGLLDYTYTEDENGVRTKITGDSFEQQYMELPPRAVDQHPAPPGNGGSRGGSPCRAERRGR